MCPFSSWWPRELNPILQIHLSVQDPWERTDIWVQPGQAGTTTGGESGAGIDSKAAVRSSLTRVIVRSSPDKSIVTEQVQPKARRSSQLGTGLGASIPTAWRRQAPRS